MHAACCMCFYMLCSWRVCVCVCVWLIHGTIQIWPLTRASSAQDPPTGCPCLKWRGCDITVSDTQWPLCACTASLMPPYPGGCQAMGRPVWEIMLPGRSVSPDDIRKWYPAFWDVYLLYNASWLCQHRRLYILFVLRCVMQTPQSQRLKWQALSLCTTGKPFNSIGAEYREPWACASDTLVPLQTADNRAAASLCVVCFLPAPPLPPGPRPSVDGLSRRYRWVWDVLKRACKDENL